MAESTDQAHVGSSEDDFIEDDSIDDNLIEDFASLTGVTTKAGATSKMEYTQADIEMHLNTGDGYIKRFEPAFQGVPENQRAKWMIIYHRVVLMECHKRMESLAAKMGATFREKKIKAIKLEAKTDMWMDETQWHLNRLDELGMGPVDKQSGAYIVGFGEAFIGMMTTRAMNETATKVQRQLENMINTGK